MSDHTEVATTRAIASLAPEMWADSPAELVERLRRLGSDVGALRAEISRLQESLAAKPRAA